MSRVAVLANRASGSVRYHALMLALPVRTLFAAWRRNLPQGWWASPACALLALFYIGALRLVLASFG